MKAALILALLAEPAAAQQAAAPPPVATGAATPAEIAARVAAMRRDMKPGQGFAWAPLMRADGAVAGLEVWRRPGAPAIHPADAEYATVLSGRGTLVSGGTMTHPILRNPGQTDGERIEGGTTRPLAPGDVILIPAGVPHWFGIDGEGHGGELVLLGMKVPQRR